MKKLNKSECEVRKIESKEAYPYLLQKHYAKRIPSISFAYGLFVGGSLVGVVTYGVPASPNLCSGICGDEHRRKVLELNRLCLDDGLPKNSASFLVARSLKMLPKPKIIVSYADTGNGHVGYVYQATNFTYTGLSDKHVQWKVKGLTGKNKHDRHIFDELGGIKKAKEILGDKMVRSERPRKHRYVIFVGCSKSVVKSLRYKQHPYPKGDTQRHNEDIEVVHMQGLDKITKT